MTPVMQTNLSRTEGNCLQASLASILKVPLESVPHFCRDHDDDSFYEELRAWLLREHGLYTMCFPRSWWAESQPVYHLISGRIGGIEHAMVGLNGKVVHNPFPGAPAEIAIEDEKFWFFIAVDPAKSKARQVTA